MVNTCTACTKTIRSTQHIQCTKCVSFFHAMCVNLSDPRKLSEDVKSAWICPNCQAKEPRRDNSNTPVRGPAPTGLSPALTVTTAATYSEDRLPQSSPREGILKLNNSTPNSPALLTDATALGDIASQLKLLREDVVDMKSQMKSLSDYITVRLEEYGSKLQAYEEREMEREALIISLKNSVSQMREELNNKAQASLKNEIEIAGATESPQENPIHLVRVTAQKIGLTIDDADIDYATRVGPRRPLSKDTHGPAKLPRPLVIRFVRRQKRDEFLKAAKSRSNLLSTDIGIEGASTKLYFNERLTLENRQLFRTCRQRTKETGIKFCWVKNGVIHLRRHEGSPAFTVKSLEDLEHKLDSVSSQK